MAWDRCTPALVARVATWTPQPLRVWKRIRVGVLGRDMVEGANGVALVADTETEASFVFAIPRSQTPVIRTLFWTRQQPRVGLWGIAVATGCHEGEVVATHRASHKVQVLNRRGDVLREWGRNGHREGDFGCPQGVAITHGPGPSGAVEVVVTERSNHRVQVFRLADGAFLRKWGTKGRAPGQFDDPADVCVTQAGEVLVSDYNNHRIQVFRLDGTFLRQWGTCGFSPGKLNMPWGMKLLGEEVLVADEGNCRVQRFRLDGAFLGWLGLEFAPRGLAVIPESGQVWVSCRCYEVAYVLQWSRKTSVP